MKRLSSVVLLMTVCGVAAFAQRPDFTGTWKQVGEPQRLTIQKIQHRDPGLKVFYDSREVPTTKGSLDRPLTMISDEHEYRTDGVEQMDNGNNGQQRWRTVGWQGSALVFLTVEKRGYHITVTRTSWTLSDSGNTLNKAIRVVDMDGVTEKTFTFQKQ